MKSLQTSAICTCPKLGAAEKGAADSASEQGLAAWVGSAWAGTTLALTAVQPQQLRHLTHKNIRTAANRASKQCLAAFWAALAKRGTAPALSAVQPWHLFHKNFRKAAKKPRKQCSAAFAWTDTASASSAVQPGHLRNVPHKCSDCASYHPHSSRDSIKLQSK